MAASHEQFREEIKAEYRARAEAGDFDEFDAFKQLCLTEYHPGRAQVTLAPFTKSQFAKNLIFLAKMQLEYWHSTLKASDESAGEGSGPTMIKISPRYMDGPDLVEAANYIREILDKNLEGPFQLATKLRKALRLKQEK
jgi:hypothetical protein